MTPQARQAFTLMVSDTLAGWESEILIARVTSLLFDALRAKSSFKAKKLRASAERGPATGPAGKGASHHASERHARGG